MLNSPKPSYTTQYRRCLCLTNMIRIVVFGAFLFGLLLQSNSVWTAPLAQSTCDEGITNGGFENGLDSDPWVESPAPDPDRELILQNASLAHSGSYYARLGNVTGDYVDELYQWVTLPAGTSSVTLTYWWYMSTEKRAGLDTLTVTIQDESGTSLAQAEPVNNGSVEPEWREQQVVYERPDAAVQETIRVHFRLQGERHGNSWKTTYVRLDDVSLLVCQPAPTVSFTTSTQTVGEAVGTVTVSAQLNTAATQMVVLPFTLTGTATYGTDYVTTLSPMTIPPGSTSAVVTVTVADDAFDENDETVVLSLGTPTNAVLGTPAVHTLTIQDNDTAGVTVMPTALAVTEGGTSRTYNVVLTSEPTADVVVALSTSADVSVSPGSLTFTPGNWDTAQTVTVTAVDDDVDEAATETHTITHSATSTDPTYNGIAVANVTVTVTDNDTAGVTVTPTTLTVTEGDPGQVYSVVLTSEPTADVTISLSGDPQITLAPLTLTFTAANWDTAQTIAVIAVDDALNEPSPQTATIRHTVTSSDANYNALSPSDVTVTVIDDDPEVDVSLSSAVYSAVESAGSLLVTVTLSAPAPAIVTVDLTTTDGSAQAGHDYVATSTTVTFPIGAQEQIVTILVVNDPHDEADETFSVTLSNPVQAAITAPGTATVTILDDDLPTTIEAGLVASPDTVTVGQRITVTMLVTNTGPTTAAGVTPQILGTGRTGQAVVADGPAPALADIPPGGVGTYTWHYTATQIGAITWVGRAQGIDDASGVPIATPIAVSNPILIRPELLMEFGTVQANGDWITVPLGNAYDEMVVVATLENTEANRPLVTRIRNAAGDHFDLKLQIPRRAGETVPTADVHYVVVESGAYTLPNGLHMEAQVYTSTTTNGKNNWTLPTGPSYLQSYTNPVVLGQVMSYEDPDFSVFWEFGASRADAPDAANLGTGKMVSKDTDITRADELIGFIVIEQSHDNLYGIPYEAQLGADTVAGMDDASPYPYTFAQAFPEPPQIALVAQAGEDGGDGGWAVLYGDDPLSADGILLAIDEEDVTSDRTHTFEQVSYLVLGSDFEEKLV